MIQYQELLRKIIDTGVDKTDRTGTGTRSIFGPQMRFDLSKGFPLLTTKKLHTKSIVHELLWILSGSTNVEYLQQNGVRIWDEWASEKGNLGPVYGHQLRNWGAGYTAADDVQVTTRWQGIDQLQQMVDLLNGTPDSRRMVVSAWNVADLPEMALSPCHCLFQFYTEPLTQQQRINVFADRHLTWTLSSPAMLDHHDIPKFRLSCQLYQRSADVFLGVPFNIASYALLTCMMAQVVNMVPSTFIWTGGDTHLYNNHFDQACEQLARDCRPLPRLELNPEVKDLFSFQFSDINFVGYDPHPTIKAPVAI